MNDRKIDFIVAVNHERYFEECKFYIEKLIVPEGYEIGLLSISDGQSMTSAYNEGMSASQAKYKVYLHQDVFILNKEFIFDILNIFMNDSAIGMMGVFGCENIPEDSVFFSNWDIGKIVADNTGELFTFNKNPDKPYIPVKAIDGLIMITQYDLPWREDIFQDWDFYDVSQSFEFRRKGYQVVIPFQKEAWCLHDCGISKLRGYEKSRTIFINEYCSEEAKKNPVTAHEYLNKEVEQAESLYRRTVALFENREIDKITNILMDIDYETIFHSKLRIMFIAMSIHNIEKDDIQRDYDFFIDNYHSWADFCNFYQEIKFMLRRIEQGYSDKKDIAFLQTLYSEKKVSKFALYVFIERYLAEKEKAYTFLFQH